MFVRSESIAFAASIALHGAVVVGFYEGWTGVAPIAIEGGQGSVQVELVSGAPEASATAAAPVLAIPRAEAKAQFVLQQPRPILPPRKLAPRPSAQRPASQPPALPVAPCAGGACPGGSGGGNATGAANGVSAENALTALRTPKPPYPWAARRDGFEGRVVLDIVVATDGHVRDAWVKASSGRTDCDRSALETVRDRWAFRPLSVAGIPIESRSRIVVVYELENS